MIRRDDLSRVRLRGKISGRRWKFFRSSAVDARPAPAPPGRDPARAFARNGRPGPRRSLYRQFPAATAGPWIRWALLPPLSGAAKSRTRTEHDAVLRNFQARTTRTSGRAEPT